ncbi:diaminopimelate epimerase [Gemmatimonas phototrophica]|uniref:diaminopimelate epimerase n=1 Tax=Gemmatimonas phototrophica TaxID=1379270 RepID=UPI0006A7324B|nr:diaminopimelate epimerase [Gemmatimonas phototrophica]
MSSLADALRGIAFAKMTGSGNDFVFFDGRTVPISLVTSPEAIQRICNRYNGIGADGVVALEPLSGDADVRIHYFNSDGTPADLCGNATLCSTALSAAIGLASADGMRLTTGAGLITSRVRGLPEIDFQPVHEMTNDIAVPMADGETRVGFVVAGIPHLVILTENAENIDVAVRGPGLRWHPATGPSGTNVNWVSPLPNGQWRYRTFERGVEGETLACGTGAVATAVMLAEWGLAKEEVVGILTSSGRTLEVRLPAAAPTKTGMRTDYRPTLRGEGRVVYRGVIEDI